MPKFVIEPILWNLRNGQNFIQDGIFQILIFFYTHLFDPDYREKFRVQQQTLSFNTAKKGRIAALYYGWIWRGHEAAFRKEEYKILHIKSRRLKKKPLLIMHPAKE